MKRLLTGNNTIIALMALNLMLWVSLRIDINLVDGGGHVALSGFPVPWYRSTLMGTSGIDVSLPLFLFDLAAYFMVLRFAANRYLFPKLESHKYRPFVAILFLVAVLPPLSSLSLAYFLDGWSSLILLPWEGWDGTEIYFRLAHGLATK
jgi:hypothetical protein